MGRQSSINIIMHNTQGGNWEREVGEEGQERPEEIMTLGNVGPRGRRGIKPRTCNNRGVCGDWHHVPVLLPCSLLPKIKLEWW